MANSFLHPLGEIHFDLYKTTDVKKALDAALQKASKREKVLIKVPSQKRTFKNTIDALCKAADELDFITGIVSHLASTLGRGWQKQEELAANIASGYYTKRSQNTQIYLAVCQVDQSNFDKFQKRLTNEIIRDYKREGIDLPPSKKQRLAKIRAELTSLSTEFSQNAVKESDKAHLLVKTSQELKGITYAWLIV